MSTLRDACTSKKALAHSILDRVRAGESIPDESVNWALTALGEPLTEGWDD